MDPEPYITAALFLLGFLPFAALAWWTATANPERVLLARRRRRRALGRDPAVATTAPDSLATELRLWRRAAPLLFLAGVAAGSMLARQVQRLFDTLR